MRSDQLLDHATEMRDVLAPMLGLARGSGRLRQISARHEPRLSLIVCDWDVPGHPPMILKCATGPAGATQIARSVAAQQEAAARLGTPELRVPAVLAHAAGLGAVAMDRAPGRTASELLELARDRAGRRAVLHRCGAWLSAFHAAFDGGRHRYNPRSLVDFLAQRRESVQAGRTQVAEPAAFCDLSARIEAAAQGFAGRPVRRARRHGDPNLRNFLIDDKTVHAIDLTGDAEAPIGHDVVRLLRDVALWGGGAAEAGPGRMLGATDWAAFFDAYRFAGPDDPSIGFVTMVQILRDWASIPADPDNRSPAESFALLTLMDLGERVTAGL